MAELFIVSQVRCYPLESRARLIVEFTNGLRGKYEGPRTEVKAYESELLASLSDQAAIDVLKIPKLRIGTGMEFDW